jgi:putative methyltransferase (TIGR04325 family)
MNIRLKNFIKYIYSWCIPPAMASFINKFRNNSWYFTGDYKTWDQALKLATGYDDKAILDRVLESTLKVKNGEAVFERDSVLFDEIQYSWPLLAGLMWIAAMNKGKINVLDFGGALGSSYFQNRKFLFDINNLQWNIVEQSHYVDAGKKYIQDGQLKFFNSIDKCFQENSVDLVIFSGVLDLIGSTHDVLEKVFLMNVKFIIVDRSVFLDDSSDSGEDKFVLQIIPPSIFPAILPFRLLSWKKMKATLDVAGYKVVENFPSIGGKGDYWEFRGFIAVKFK